MIKVMGKHVRMIAEDRQDRIYPLPYPKLVAIVEKVHLEPVVRDKKKERWLGCKQADKEEALVLDCENEGKVDEVLMLEFLQSHAAVINQPGFDNSLFDIPAFIISGAPSFIIHLDIEFGISQ